MAEDTLRLVGKRRIVERAAGIAGGGGDPLAQRLAAGGHLDFGREGRGEEFQQRFVGDDLDLAGQGER